MIAIPSQPITITSTNIPEGNMTHPEWTAGTYALDDIVKITDESIIEATYIGGIYTCLLDSNSLSPLVANSGWHKWGDSLYESNEGVYPEWIAGSCNKNNHVQVTTSDISTKYVGAVYKSLIVDNTSSPLDDDGSWIKIDVLEYDNGRTYSAGDTVSDLSTHNIYLSMEDNNDTSPLNPDSLWQFISKTNAYDFNDFYFTTVTEAYNQDLVMEFTFEKSDKLSMFGIFGASTTIEQLDGAVGDALYNFTKTETSDTNPYAYIRLSNTGVDGGLTTDIAASTSMRVTMPVFIPNNLTTAQVAIESTGWVISETLCTQDGNVHTYSFDCTADGDMTSFIKIGFIGVGEELIDETFSIDHANISIIELGIGSPPELFNGVVSHTSDLSLTIASPVIAKDFITRVDTTTISNFATYLQFLGCGDINQFQLDLIYKLNQKVRVTITSIAYNGKNLVELATLSVGRQRNLGCTLYGLKSTRTAISPPVYDKWGEVNLLGDDYVKLYSGKMTFETNDIDYIDGIIDGLFNQPVVYLLSDNAHNAFNTFGLMTVGEISADDASLSSMPLKIKSFKHRRNTKEC